MPKKDKIIAALYEAVDEVNDIIPAEQKLSKSLDTPLYGQDSRLDSVNLVQFIVTAEQKIEENLDVHLALASEKAFSLQNSPFRTIGTLAEFAASALRSVAGDD